MSLKRRLHTSYKKVKYSKKWRTNRLLAAIQPLFKLIVAWLIFAYQKIYLPLKRSRPGRRIRALKAGLWKNITTFDSSADMFKVARLAARASLWSAAQRTYSLALTRELAKENKNKNVVTVSHDKSLPIRTRLQTAYKRMKYSSKWQTNPLLDTIRPLFVLMDKFRIYIYQQTYLRLKRSSSGRAIRSWRANARKRRVKLLPTALGDTKRSRPRLEHINEARFNLSVINRLVNSGAYKEQINEYNRSSKTPRIAIYTAIAGGYDTIKLPEVLMPGVDYFLFTDRPAPDAGVFKIRPLPYYHIDTPRMTRYVKTHPHQLLAEYDIAIWVDANILITGDISSLIANFIKSKKAVGAIPHPLRQTIHEEAEACIFYNKDDERFLKEQVDHYKALGYDTNELIESNIMMFDLKNEQIPGFFATWWSEIDKFTRRDQLSLNYSLDENHISWHRIMERPQNARNHPLFVLVPHSVRQTSVAALNRALGRVLIDPYEGPSFASIKDQVVKDRGERKIDVVYCVYNALDDVKLCLASVVKYRPRQNFKLIIVDDNSDGPTADFLQNFQKKHSQWVKLIRHEVSVGYTKAANRGLKASSGELVILLNSDTIVTAEWSEKMAAAVFSTAGAGIVGPLSSAASHQSIPNHIGSDTQTATNELPKGLSPDEINKHCEKWSVANFYPRVPLVHGFCFGLTRAVIDKVGYFDEKSFPNGYGEENDYCFRAIDAGFGLIIATNTYVFHAKSKSYPSETRIKLMKQGSAMLRKLRGKERIYRAIRSVLANPYLQKFRDNTRALYQKYES